MGVRTFRVELELERSMGADCSHHCAIHDPRTPPPPPPPPHHHQHARPIHKFNSLAILFLVYCRCINTAQVLILPLQMLA